MVWVSSNPYQLGEFVAYDLNEIFDGKEKNFVVLGTDSLNIPKDTFISSQAYQDYENYRIKDKIFDEMLNSNEEIAEEFIEQYQSLNPNHWIVYYKAGKYYYRKKQFGKAKTNFETAITKEITNVPDKIEIEKYIKKIKRKGKLQ
jgi:tetratricopeptide (TPR) repeat protein